MHEFNTLAKACKWGLGRRHNCQQQIFSLGNKVMLRTTEADIELESKTAPIQTEMEYSKLPCRWSSATASKESTVGTGCTHSTISQIPCGKKIASVHAVNTSWEKACREGVPSQLLKGGQSLVRVTMVMELLAMVLALATASGWVLRGSSPLAGI